MGSTLEYSTRYAERKSRNKSINNKKNIEAFNSPLGQKESSGLGRENWQKKMGSAGCLCKPAKWGWLPAETTRHIGLQQEFIPWTHSLRHSISKTKQNIDMSLFMIFIDFIHPDWCEVVFIHSMIARQSCVAGFLKLGTGECLVQTEELAQSLSYSGGPGLAAASAGWAGTGEKGKIKSQTAFGLSCFLEDHFSGTLSQSLDFFRPMEASGRKEPGRSGQVSPHRGVHEDKQFSSEGTQTTKMHVRRLHAFARGV